MLSQIVSIPIYSIRKLTRKKIFPAYKVDGKNQLYDPDEVVEIIKKGLADNINNDTRASETVTDTHKED